MRIAWLTTRPPFPANAGGKIAVYWRVRAMADLGHEIDLVGAASGESAEVIDSATRHLGDWCRTVEFVDPAPKATSLRWLAAGTPWGAARRVFDERTVQRLADRLASVDVVLVDQSGMVPAARQLMDAWGVDAPPMVVVQFADAARSLRLTARQSPPTRQATLLAEALAYRRLDRSIVRDRRVAHVCFVSSAERDRVVASDGLAADRSSFHPLPFPVDDVRVAQPRSVDGRQVLLFVASFDDPGNRIAAAWLVDQVLPSLYPGAFSLVLAGRRASTLPYSARDGLRVESDVPDLDDLFDEASMVLVPVQGGGGVRVKLLEAIARGLPVVTTRLGVEGTAFTTDHVAIADAAGDFAATIERVASDPAGARLRAGHARDRLLEMHRPEAVARRLEETLRPVAKTASR